MVAPVCRGRYRQRCQQCRCEQGLVIPRVPPLPQFYPLSCTKTVVINWAAHFFSLVSICSASNLSGKENPPFLEAFLPFSIT